MTDRQHGLHHEYTPRAVYEKMAEYAETGTAYILCILAWKEGSVPREAGALMTVSETEICGTVGGGASEARAVEAARGMLGRKAARYSVLETDMSGSQGTDMICGGRVKLLLIPDCRTEQGLAARICGNAKDRVFLYLDTRGTEPLLELRGEEEMPHGISPADGSVFYEDGIFAMPAVQPKRAFLFGAGHIAVCLCPLLDSIGFAVTVVDDRPELTVAERFPEAERVLCCGYDELEKVLDVETEDYTVTATRGHEKDFEALSFLLGRKPYYMACVGSRSKAAKVRRRLLEAGFPEAEADRIHSPAGLPIGGRSPAEIAVSIAAQMIMARYGVQPEDLCGAHGSVLE